MQERIGPGSRRAGRVRVVHCDSRPNDHRRYSSCLAAAAVMSLAPAGAFDPLPGVPGVGDCGRVPGQTELERVRERVAFWRG